jgi:peptide deformylase
MAQLKVAKLGDPILRQKVDLVDLDALKSKEDKIHMLIEDMIETMRREDGVGLAAPQVFHSLSLVVIECSFSDRYSDAPNIPLTVLVNPSIKHYGEETSFGWEGCLSLKDLRGLVPRSKQITVEYFDQESNQVTVNAEGFLAVVLQHEIDHLNGKVFLDRMNDISKLAYVEEFEKYIIETEVADSELI